MASKQQVHELRKKGYNLKDIAKITGLSFTTVQRITSGRTRVEKGNLTNEQLVEFERLRRILLKVPPEILGRINIVLKVGE